MDAETQNQPDGTVKVTARRSPVKRALLMAAVPVVLLLGAGAWWITSGGSEKTDNAYLHQARLSVASQLGGRVTAVAVAENQAVKTGDLLFQIDAEPYRIALARAEVSLDAARLDVRRLKASYAEAEAQAKLAHDTADYEAGNLTRQTALATKGVATDSSLDDARHAAKLATEQAAAADIAIEAALAALGGKADAAVDDHPTVRAAMVARDAAEYDLRQTEIHAPADGVIYQASSFRNGQMVAAGQTVFTLVETGDTWVEANFKESQLGTIRVGQPVEVVLDMARGTHLVGRVEAIGAGTGAEFSLLPAQNATGNWVKVEQRVPVRIRLQDPDSAPLLASGLSAEVVIDTRSATAPAGAAVAGTVTQ